MSLFDDIHVDYALPDDCPLRDFQTQSFPNPYMDKYIIAKNGRLLIHTGGVCEGVDPYGNFWATAGAECYEDTNFHGDVVFYGSVSGEWREYKARFTEGQLQWIRRIEAA